MESARTRVHRISMLGVGLLLIVAASTVARLLLPTQRWDTVPFHSTVEAVGGLMALTLAAFLMLLRSSGEKSAHHVWTASALVGMGLLDGFHASVPPGDAFVWLHSTAGLVGGLLIVGVWLPDRLSRSRWGAGLPWGVALTTALFGAVWVVFPHATPDMVRQGEFTTAARAINLLGGLLFVAAAVRFVRRYWTDETADDLLFASLCVLFAAAGLVFPLSEVWLADWWLWHLLRLIAYVIALGYVFALFQRAQAALREARDELELRVQERTAELAEANEALEAEAVERKQAQEAVAQAATELQQIFDIAGDGMLLIDKDFQILRANQTLSDMMGLAETEAPGQKCHELIRSSLCHTPDCPLTQILGGKTHLECEAKVQRRDGQTLHCVVAARPFVSPEGDVIGIVEDVNDVTERTRAEQVIRQQAEEILELSTPVMVAWEGVVVAPLIGVLDSRRTQQFMDKLLENIVQANAAVALIDITGVPTIDTKTGQHLIETIRAVKLLGAEVVLTGVRPAIAQTLVHLGVDLSSVTTRASLAAGLRVALQALKLKVTQSN